jgi:hypothetical protein
MRFSRAKWVWSNLILLVSLTVYQFQVTDAHAQSANTISVESTTATSDFPDAVDFTLTAIVSNDVAAVDIVYTEASLPTLELIPATFDQADNALTASATSDMATYFVPVGIDLTYHWVVTFTDDTVVETDDSIVTWEDTRFDWTRTDGEGVEIYGYDRSAEFTQFVLGVATDAIKSLTTLYAPAQVQPIRIWLYESGEDFAGTRAANSQEWAAGAAYPSLQVIAAVIPDKSESETLRIIPHEISHQILYQATLNPYNSPATWIDEGLAVTAQVGGKDHYQKLVENARRDDQLLSLRGLISAFPYSPSEASLAYGESFLVTQFIIAQYGDQAIQGIIAAYRSGASHDQVIKEALGMSIEELEAAWIASLDAGANLDLAA